MDPKNHALPYAYKPYLVLIIMLPLNGSQKYTIVRININSRMSVFLGASRPFFTLVLWIVYYRGRSAKRSSSSVIDGSSSSSSSGTSSTSSTTTIIVV